MLPQAQIDRVVVFLDENLGLHARFDFGSEAAGAGRCGSDLDLAALLRRRPDARDRVPGSDRHSG